MDGRRIEPDGWIAERSEIDKMKRAQASVVEVCCEFVAIKLPSQTQASTENLINCDF